MMMAKEYEGIGELPRREESSEEEDDMEESWEEIERGSPS